MSLTGFFYLRNNRGDLLIDPTTGLPVRSSALPTQPFLNLGYDRQPDFTIGLTNTLHYIAGASTSCSTSARVATSSTRPIISSRLTV